MVDKLSYFFFCFLPIWNIIHPSNWTYGYTGDVPLPDITTKEKAQQYIGLDMAAEKVGKDKFLEEIVPEWLQKAKANGRIVD